MTPQFFSKLRHLLAVPATAQLPRARVRVRARMRSEGEGESEGESERETEGEKDYNTTRHEHHDGHEEEYARRAASAEPTTSATK